MSISKNNEIFLDSILDQENSLINSIKILSDITIRDIKKIEKSTEGNRKTYYCDSNGQNNNKKID
jgi:hypothetical protein